MTAVHTPFFKSGIAARTVRLRMIEIQHPLGIQESR